MSLLLLLGGAVLGAALGSVAGLFPGVHPNGMAVVAIGALPGLPGEMALAAAAGLVAMGLAHQCTSIVPSGFLGAPGPEDALRALPAQQLLHEGRAHEAVLLATRGTVAGALAAMALVLPLRLLLGPEGSGYDWLEPVLPVVLVAIAAILLLTEDAEVPWRRALLATPFGADAPARVAGTLRERRATLLRVATPEGTRWVEDSLGLVAAEPGQPVVVHGRWARVAAPGARALGVALALAVFVLSGALGWTAMRLATPSPLGLPGSPMFPLLTGLFGVPSLLLALGSPPLPRQWERPAAEPGAEVARGSIAGAACGSLVGLLPGMSSSAATVLAMLAAPARSREGTLVTLSAAGAGAAVITTAAYVLVGRARSGAMLAVEELVPPAPWIAAPPQLLAVLLLGCAVGLAVGLPATLLAGRAAARIAHRVPYALLSAAVLVLLVALVAVSTGLLGLGVLVVATAVGLLPWRWGLRKGHLMGCTMLPLIAAGLAGG